MSLLASFQSGLKEACLDYRDCCGSPYHYMLIITPANLFCSMHTQMNINAMEDDSRVCVCRMNTHRQMQIGAKSWIGTQRRTRTLLRALCALPSETAEPPLQLRGGRKTLDTSHTQKQNHTHTHSHRFLA